MIGIKNMKMPEKCIDCRFCHNVKGNDYGSFGKCMITEEQVNLLLWEKDFHCPLIEISNKEKER